MKNIKLFTAILSALVLATPIISLAQITNVSGKDAPDTLSVIPSVTQMIPAGTKPISTSNSTVKCGVNTFSVSNECGVDAFKNSYVQCYDGYTENQGGESSCKSSSMWQEYAKNICESRCKTNTTTTSQPPTVISSGGSTLVTVNRCDEVKQWENKITYYQKLKELSDTDLKNKTNLSKNEIEITLNNLEEGIRKVKEQCNLQTATGSTSSASSQTIIADPTKPVAVQSAQEIDAYYKAKIENISAIQNTPQQVEKLQALKQEKNQLVGDLIKNRNEIEATEINQVATDVNVNKNEIRVDNVTVEAIGKKILLNVGDRPISVESGGNQVLIKDKNLEVTTDNVSISNNSLKIGGIEVKITASQAAEKLNIKPNVVQLTTENFQPVYKMETSESRKLFGFIKINIGKTQTVNADNGNLIGEKHSWYYFLTTK